MNKIFISYRRQDSGGYVIGIYNRMLKDFDAKDIFRDIDTLDYGIDFVDSIQKAVQQCSIMLAIIGPHWLNIQNENGIRRLDDEHDFVRVEIATALARGIIVLPVLVGGASMPSTDKLPKDMQPLTRRNALVINDKDFDSHTARLVRAIKKSYILTYTEDPTFAPQKTESEIKKVLKNVGKVLGKPFDWCWVPRGKHTTYYHRMVQTCDISEFYVSKYPITNKQFGKFIDAGGYTYPNWWSIIGWKACKEGWNSQGQPTEQPWTTPIYWSSEVEDEDYPVIGLSLYEADAFCKWLSEKSEGLIRIPSEPEWQRAAYGDNETYKISPPINEEPRDQDFYGPAIATKDTPHPNPFNIVGMYGNVLEWCILTDGHFNDSACLRGGIWANVHTEAQTKKQFIHKLHASIYNREYLFGLRLVYSARW